MWNNVLFSTKKVCFIASVNLFQSSFVADLFPHLVEVSSMQLSSDGLVSSVVLTHFLIQISTHSSLAKDLKLLLSLLCILPLSKHLLNVYTNICIYLLKSYISVSSKKVVFRFLSYLEETEI